MRESRLFTSGGRWIRRTSAFLIDDRIDKPRILVAEAVVVLPPGVRAEEVVEGSDGAPPWNPFLCDLESFGILIEREDHDVDEGLKPVEKAIAAGQDMAFQ